MTTEKCANCGQDMVISNVRADGSILFQHVKVSTVVNGKVKSFKWSVYCQPWLKPNYKSDESLPVASR